MTGNNIKISLIAGMGENRVIGNNNTLVWDIPKDMAWFRKKTRGKTVIMGRKTFESIGYPLPKRDNIVISRKEDFSIPKFPEVKTTSSLEDALNIAKKHAQDNNLNEVFIIGGAQIYELGLDFADRLYLTYIEKSYEGDTFFPEFDKNNWDISYKNYHEAEGNTPALTFTIYDKKLNL